MGRQLANQGAGAGGANYACMRQGQVVHTACACSRGKRWTLCIMQQGQVVYTLRACGRGVHDVHECTTVPAACPYSLDHQGGWVG